MTTIFQRHLVNQSQGIYTNLRPSDRLDREAMGGWYFDIQIGTWRLSILGNIKPNRTNA